MSFYSIIVDKCDILSKCIEFNVVLLHIGGRIPRDTNMNLEVRKSGYKLAFSLLLLYIVDHKPLLIILHMRKINYVVSFNIIIIIHNRVHIFEMRSRRVELESNPSYITIQPSRTCTADYENVTVDTSSILHQR